MIMEAIKTLNIKTVEPTKRTLPASTVGPAKLFKPRRVEDTMSQFGPNMNRLQEADEVHYTTTNPCSFYEQYN
jgi:hypothetical protein